MDDLLTAKKEIVKTILAFIENPNDERVLRSAIEIEKKYASLCTINEYKKEKVVPDIVMEAVSFMQEIYQYNDGVFDKENSLKKAEEILSKLK